jgi:putrescine transport system ATP-binding protein
VTAQRFAQAEPWRDPDAVPYVRVEGVGKRFGDVVALDDVSLDIYQGEFFSLLGGSGSGKTTLLRVLAGFETPEQGRVLIDGVDMTGVPPYERPVNMMFQSYALFPHMSVADNIAFGLRQDKVATAEINRRVGEVLELVQLGSYGKRRPHQLSGGQRQRVALARALVKRPKLLLLDEPLAALDRKLREETQFELVNIQEQVGITFIIVTHDQEEAMTMSSRIAVMEHGRIAQIGTPSETYEYPANRFVAGFIGQINLFEGRVAAIEGEHVFVTSDGGVSLHVQQAPGSGPALAVGHGCAVAVRPEKVTIAKDTGSEPNAPNRTAGIVRDIAYHGDLSCYVIDLPDGQRMRVTTPNLTRRTEMPISWGETVSLTWRPQAGVILTE